MSGKKRSLIIKNKTIKGALTSAILILIAAVGWIVVFSAHITKADAINNTDFVITVKTDNPGPSSNTQFRIPTTGSGYNYTVDCNNDGVIDATARTGTYTCSYPSAGIYTIRIGGTFPRIYFTDYGTNNADRLKIIQVNQWGTGSWRSFERAFQGASNLEVVATDAPNLAQVTNMSYMFTAASSLVGNASFDSWDTSNVTNMRNLFFGASSFNSPVGSWNVSKVTNMRSMFNGASSFNQPLNNWDTSKVTDTAYMFRSAAAFNQPIGAWNTSNVTLMQYMFQFATAFNQPVGSWDTSKVTNMSYMFGGTAAFNQSLNSWNTSSLTNTGYMFQAATAFNQPLDSWDMSKVTDIQYMFNEAESFNGDVDSWNTSNVTDMNNVFHNAHSFNKPLNGWNTSKVTSMRSIFNRAYAFNQPLDSWDVSKVTMMNYALYHATSFNQSLGAWGMTVADSMTEMLSFSGMSIASYDDTLTGWSTKTLRSGNTLGATGLHYCTAQASRDVLTSTRGWTINDDGLACPPTSISLSNNRVDEHTKPVGTISSTGTNAPHTYTLVSGVGDEDNNKFTLNSGTGALAFVDGPDFENPTDLGDTPGNNTYSVRIQAKNSVGQILEQVFIVTVLDVDDVAPEITIIPGVKSSTGPILDTTIEVSDRFSIAAIEVDNTSTATADSLACSPVPGSTTSSTDFPYINSAPSPSNHLTLSCTIRITSTGRLAIKATDVAGYSSTATELNYVIDTTGPNFSSAYADTETYGVNQPIIHFQATDAVGVDRYEIAYRKDNAGPGVDSADTVDTVPATVNSHTINLDPDEATHVVEVTAYDTLGNLTVRRIVFPPSVVISAPTIASNAPINDATVTITTPVAGDLIDNITLSGPASAGVTLSNCTDINSNTTAPYNTKVTCGINNIHTTGMLIIEAKDITTGAVGSNSQKFFYDNVAPTISINAPTKLSDDDITDTLIVAEDDVLIMPSGVTIDPNSTATAEDLVCVTSAIEEKRIRCTVRVTSSGDLVVKATDISGNIATLTEVNYIIDRTPPVVSIASTATITESNQANYGMAGTCTAGDGDVLVTIDTQPYTTECQADGTWLLVVSLSSQPDGLVNVAAKQTDAVGHSTEVFASLTKDTIAPVAGMSSVVTNVGSPQLNGVVDDPQAIITVTIDGNTYGAINNGDGSWSLAAGQIAPSLVDGTYDVSLSAEDEFGNSEAYLQHEALVIDTIRPDVTINQAVGQADPTNIDEAIFTVILSEPVDDLSANSFTVSGSSGSVTSLTQDSNIEYMVVVTGMTSGDTVELSLDENSVYDIAGNGNTASTSTDNSVHYTTDRPTVAVSLAPGQAAYTDTQPVELLVSFSKPVTGFDASDISVVDSTATVSSIVSTDDQVYTITLSGLTDGDALKLSVADNAAEDAAGNLSQASAGSPTVYFDTSDPVITITAPTTVSNNEIIDTVITVKDNVAILPNAIEVDASTTATFGDFVCAVDASDDAQINCSIRITGSGNLVIKATDATGNEATASQSYTIDQAAPVVKITTTTTINQSNASNYSIEGNCTAGDGDVTVSINSSLPQTVSCNGSGDWSITLDLSSQPDGVVVVVASQTDAAGNNAQDTVSLTKDTTAPTVSISSQTVNTQSPQLTGAVDDPDASVNITINGAAYTAANNGDGTWSLPAGAISPGLADGSYSVTIEATDTAGNTATQTIVDALTIDTVQPSVIINQAVGQADPTNIDEAKFTVALSEPVSDLVASSFTVGGSTGSVTSLVQDSPTAYTATVTGMTSGDTVELSLAANSIHDVAGNGNAASTSTDNSVHFVTDRPTATITLATGQSEHTNTQPVKFAVTFSVPVTGFDDSDITVSGSSTAIVSVTTVDNKFYEVTLNGLTDGDEVSLSVADNAAEDAAGNLSQASTSSPIIYYDTTAPTATIERSPDQISPTTVNSARFRVLFTEPVLEGSITTSAFTVIDSTGLATAVAKLSDTEYEITVTGMTDGDEARLRLLAGFVRDLAGNLISVPVEADSDNAVVYGASSGGEAPSEPGSGSGEPDKDTSPNSSDDTLSETGINIYLVTLLGLALILAGRKKLT